MLVQIIFYLLLTTFLAKLLAFLLASLVAAIYVYHQYTNQLNLLFVLDLNGHCQFKSDQLWLITSASRIGYLGCYVNLVKIDTFSHQIEHPFQQQNYFIFKDSLSAASYSRICRIINKVKLFKQDNSN